MDDFGKVWIIPGGTGNEKIFVVAYLEIDLIYLKLEIDEVISNSINYTEMYQGLRYVFDVFFVDKQLHKNDESKVLVDKVEQYLKGHLSESVSHQQLSEIFGLVPYYLSSSLKNIKVNLHAIICRTCESIKPKSY